MAEIIFQSKEDAEKLYQLLLKFLKVSPENKKVLLIEDQHIIRIIEDTLSSKSMKQVKKAFYEFVTVVKRDDWFKGILAENYFFTDPEEQRHVLDIIYSILEGERKELEIFLEKSKHKQRVKEAIDQVLLNNISLSFDSFVKFRLRPYLHDLESYVKVSLDEYKMEQEYQIFVQTLRDFLQGRTPKMEILHLVFDEEIVFFNDCMEEMKRSELVKMIDRKLISNHPVYVDSATIAPLLSIAPVTIFIYANRRDEALVRTIANIFEERVTIMPIHSFYNQLQCKEWKENDA